MIYRQIMLFSHAFKSGTHYLLTTAF